MLLSKCHLLNPKRNNKLIKAERCGCLASHHIEHEECNHIHTRGLAWPGPVRRVAIYLLCFFLFCLSIKTMLSFSSSSTTTLSISCFSSSLLLLYMLLQMECVLTTSPSTSYSTINKHLFRTLWTKWRHYNDLDLITYFGVMRIEPSCRAAMLASNCRLRFYLSLSVFLFRSLGQFIGIPFSPRVWADISVCFAVVRESYERWRRRKRRGNKWQISFALNDHRLIHNVWNKFT